MWVCPEIFLWVFYDNLCWLGSIGGYPPHIYHHIFWQYVGPIFSWEKINEYFWFILHVCSTSPVGGTDPQKLIWIDTQGSLTHIATIFKFGDVSGPRAKKWPKVNRQLKIVNYFTCMRHFSCRGYRPPEVDLNGYPMISNQYCCNIQIRRCEWTQGKKMTQSKSRIKNSKLFYMYAALLL